MSTPASPSAADAADGVQEHGGIDPAAPVDGDLAPYGTPGRPFDRRSPFFYGFVGGLGALTAFLLFKSLTAISSVLMLVVVAFFLAAGLNPAVEALERRGLRRSFAVTVVLVIAFVALGLFLVAIVPVITDQVTAITKNAPAWLDELQRNKQIQDLNREYDVIDKAKAFIEDGDFLSSLFGGVLGVGLKVISALFNLFVIIVLTLYFLASLKTTTGAIYKLAPASRRERVSKLGDKVIANIGGYVSGAFLVALCAGMSSLVFLWFTDIREYAVALAFVVALLDVIPMIGATIGAVIVSAIAFATDIKTGIACVIFYVVYQQVENYVIYPRVMSKSVDLPGAVIVIAALVGAGLLGVVGALLAIPVAAAVLLILREVVVKQQDLR
ncbi:MULTISPECIES: AI-2E family transporter [Pimelobacter]|uniref:AI-2E family transporter n=1 Tax=Pimelobacter TaxID=2044 RepID=UPI001C0530FA|nr:MULTISPECIES: AI-2E family transporter [Pimelobacter]MBU2696747.1 AI-2E family transporter [Pimelobacter sp. 30-1]UUW87464.1 AI-2E family transporter [Pimelobacter simplex]UUW96969.1 AI-2E family transporter [Pimelobacter simplex]